ncbi:MAG: MBL fold metallo-hydrolase, partial [Paludibacteraceae bacterium]|nr:MBL fold metallo-hydrolase [Paludibacteraceae bacterium]
PKYPTVTPDEFEQAIAEPDVQLVDVRTPEEYEQGHIVGAMNIDGLRIYIAGDTEDIPEMADIKNIDIAFLPCNQPYTMTPEQLIEAARIIQPKVLFPYHYSQTDVTGIPAQLPDMDVRIRHYE